MARRSSEPLTLGRIGKFIWSALFFPLNAVVTGCAYAAAEGLRYVNFVEAFFVQSALFKGMRELAWDPFWKAISENSQKTWKSLAGLTLNFFTEPVKIISETTKSVIDKSQSSIAAKDLAELTKKEMRDRAIKKEGTDTIPNPIILNPASTPLVSAPMRQQGVTSNNISGGRGA